MANDVKSETGGANRRTVLTGAAVAAVGIAGIGLNGGARAQNGEMHDRRSHRAHSADRRMLGDLEVSAIGMGVQNQHRTFSSLVPNRADMVSLIREAHDLGVTFFDCAEVYGPFHCEEILGEAIEPIRDQVQITTKFGFDVDPETGENRNRVVSEPARIRRAVEGSLRRLKTDRVDLLYQHRVDPDVPIEDVAGTVRDLMDEGKVLHWGLSEMGPNTLRRAHAELPVTAVQNEYSMLYRGLEDDILPITRELGVGFVPFAPLGYGFLTGAVDMTTQFSPLDFRSMTTRMDPENRERNMPLVDIAREWASRKNTTPGQIALAWLMAQRGDIVPIPGTTNLMHLRDNVAAAEVTFDAAELAELSSAVRNVRVAGTRAPELVMEWNGTEAPDAI